MLMAGSICWGTEYDFFLAAKERRESLSRLQNLDQTHNGVVRASILMAM